MDKEILVSGSPVEIAEHGDYKLATFMISVLDEFDRNGRMIPKESGELYHATMIGFPILAKMVCDEDGEPVDFAGHEMYVTYDEAGNASVRFNTHPIGSVVESWIEDRQVAGYAMPKSCIMIKAKLWSSRYPEYFTVLDKLWASNNVKSSWELTVQDVVQTAKGRILKAFSFIGNTLLGSNILGAVPGAGVYEYAELDPEIQLATALSKDICRAEGAQRKEDEMLENEMRDDQIVAETTEPVVDAPAVAEVDGAEMAEEISDVAEAEVVDTTNEEIAETEVADPAEGVVVEEAMLTERDLRYRINEAYRTQYDKWGWVAFWFPAANEAWVEEEGRSTELDFVRVTYSVENDEIKIVDAAPVKLSVSVSELNDALNMRDEAIEKANARINELSAQVAGLQPYKDAADEAERVRVEAEIAEKRKAFREKMLASKLFAEDEIEASEALKEMIDTLNENAFKNEIAERFMKKLENDPVEAKPEVASVEDQTRVVVGDSEKINNNEFMRALLYRK